MRRAIVAVSGVILAGFTASASGPLRATPPDFNPADSRATPPGTWVNITPPQIPPMLPFVEPQFGMATIGLSPVAPSTIYVGTNYNGIFKSTDGGNNWVKINTGANSVALDKGRNWTLAVDPTNVNTLYTVAGYGPVQQGIFKSVNGGVDWKQMLTGSTLSQTTGDIYSIAIDPLNHLHLLVGSHSPWNFGSNAGVLESLDGGQKWILHASQGPWGAGHYVFFLGQDDAGGPSSAAWLLATQGNGFWRTLDSGTTWTQVSSTENMQHGAGQLYRAITGALYTGAVQHPLRSTDNGRTWTAVGPPNTRDGYNAIIGDGTYLYAQSANTGASTTGPHPYYYSLETDGTMWQPYSDQTFADGPVSMAFDARNRILYSSNWCAGLWRLATGH